MVGLKGKTKAALDPWKWMKDTRQTQKARNFVGVGAQFPKVKAKKKAISIFWQDWLKTRCCGKKPVISNK